MHHDTNVQMFEEKVARTESFEQLAELAMRELCKFSDGAALVCGPITTGGLGNVPDNLALFSTTIVRLQGYGRDIFTQMPYEKNGIFRLTRKWKDANPNDSDYHAPVLESFYRPLFESGYVNEGIFLPDWKSSRGACWERALLTELRITVSDLPADWAETFQCS